MARLDGNDNDITREKEQKPAPWLASLIIQMAERLRLLKELRHRLTIENHTGAEIVATVEEAVIYSLRELMRHPYEDHKTTEIKDVLSEVCMVLLETDMNRNKNTLHNPEYNTILPDVNENTIGEREKNMTPVLLPSDVTKNEPGVTDVDIPQWGNSHTLVFHTTHGVVKICKCQWCGATFIARKHRQRCPGCGSTAWEAGEYQVDRSRYIHSRKRQPRCPDTN